MTAETRAGRVLVAGRIPATADAVRAKLTRVGDAARRAGLGDGRRSDLEIVLGEVLNNIVEHAFEGRRPGWIDCLVQSGGAEDDVHAEIRDDGMPLPPMLLLQDHGLPELGAAPEDLPEGGFGWFIVHALTDDMMYEREAGENRLTFSLGGGG